jgi:hypothetical protein
MRRISLALVSMGALASADAHAQPPPPNNANAAPAVAAPAAPRAREPATSPDRDSEAYCRYIKAAADSESDPFLLPGVYGTTGYVSGADASAGASALPPTQRLIAGAFYNFGATGLSRGLALRSVADTECKRYAIEAQLRAFIERYTGAPSTRALAAKTKALEDALPHASEILASQRARLAQARITVDEVDATQIRADALRTLAAESRAQLEGLASAPPVAERPIRDVLTDRDSAEIEAEKSAAWLRQTRGWDLTIRGGYDRIFGVRDYTPLFASATLTFNIGWLFQGANDHEAEAARRDWVRAEVLGFDDRVEQTLQLLRATRDAEAGRLRETTILLADLEGRYKTISTMEGEKARTYAESVWFDLSRVRAEHAYYEEHVREMNALLGDAEK